MFNVGDTVRRIRKGPTLNTWYHENYTFTVRFIDKHGVIRDDYGAGHNPLDLELVAQTDTPDTDNPFIHIVERRELTTAGSVHFSCGMLTMDREHRIGMTLATYNPAELRTIARILTEIADVLDS